MINAVIDLSHHNAVADFAKVKAAHVLGVIAKATQGTHYADPLFATHTRQASAAGLMVGAYHFGTAGDPVGQADRLVSTAGTKTLLVLDFEGNPQGSDMTLDEAEQFVNRIQAVTGRYPGLYSGHTIKQALIDAKISQPEHTVLSQCWLWMAQYAKAPLIPAIWNTWTLWQYTDGGVGPVPHEVDGVGACDRDQFNGTAEELVAFWQRNSG